jgi:NADPH-dependent 2,4-dienoyl-CoA reductase/sulfur reductase-like enzyme
MEERDFVVIGAGPAGVSAAVRAAKAGAEVTVIGEDPQIGGQIFRQLVPPLKVRSPIMEMQDYEILENLRKELADINIEFLNKTIVWGIFDDKVIAFDKDNKSLIKAKKILIAEGAYEAPVAFPGWTLPGVITLGGLQILLKGQGVIPKGKILIAGTGPLLFYTASQLVKNGADVVAVFEASSFGQWIKWTMQLWRAPGILAKGLKYLAILKKHRVPVYYNTIPLEARGGDKLKEVMFAKCDNQWRPIAGTEKKRPVDILSLNFGFIPSTQFTHIAECEHSCDIQLRGWVPKFNSRYETSREGIYVAGDCTGIGGVKIAVWEGELVGNEVARCLGYLSPSEAEHSISVLQRKLSRYRWYQHFLNKIYRFRPGLLDLLTDETLICRCEEVNFKTLSHLIEKGSHRLEQIKLLSRTGMGRCQGRFCYPLLLGILSEKLSASQLINEDFIGRIPAKPLPLETLFDLSDSPDIEKEDV